MNMIGAIVFIHAEDVALQSSWFHCLCPRPRGKGQWSSSPPTYSSADTGLLYSHLQIIQKNIKQWKNHKYNLSFIFWLFQYFFIECI